jgi:hypothetical protein
MRPTLILPISLLIIAALATLLVRARSARRPLPIEPKRLRPERSAWP